MILELDYSVFFYGNIISRMKNM